MFLNFGTVKSFTSYNVKAVTQRCLPKTSRFQYTSLKHKSSLKINYCSEVEKVINRQINAEQQAAQDYLNMAVHFLHSGISRPGTGSYFMSLHHEEMSHMHGFIEYQLCRGGQVKISSLKQPQSNTDLSMKSAFERAFLMEQEVTKLLEDVVKVAESVNDQQCIDFVVNKYLSEQMKSMNELVHHITNLERFKDDNSLYQFDLQLLKGSHKTK